MPARRRFDVSEAQRRAREQEHTEALAAVAVRGWCGERDLHFRGGRLHRGRRALPCFAPHLKASLASDDPVARRGAADGYGLRLACSDAPLHASLAPADPVQRMLFEWLEQFRCEALVPAGMLGARRNLRHGFEAWSLAFHDGGGTDGAGGLLLYTVAQMCRARVTGEPVVEATEDLLEATRAGIGPLIGSALAGLKRARSDQRAYAVHARAIAQTIAEMLDAVEVEASRTGSRLDEFSRAAMALWIETGEEADTGFAAAISGRSPWLDRAPSGYRVFTTAYDCEVAAATLVRAELLREYRERLDRRIAGLGVNVARLARDLHALLAVPAREGWDGGQEEGHLDGRRLAQLVASPAERRLFRVEREDPRPECLVTLLIDCSGSMKAHIEAVAVLVDVLVRALEQAGVASEVLGYTTAAWNGGRARRDWVRAGRPPHPGRLNEVCHLVFKDADTGWRRARPAIAALLKAELFRDGIDGEALAWARRRARARSEQRQLLLVFSDGSPMDGATGLANDAHYLDHHLKDEVARFEAAGAEIYGIGVGLDLSPYYSRSHVLDLSGALGTPQFRELIDLIGRGSRR